MPIYTKYWHDMLGKNESRISNERSKGKENKQDIILFQRWLDITVNYRYNVIDGTLKKLRYIRFYVIPV